MPLIGGLSNAASVPIYNVVIAVVGMQGAVPARAMRTAVISVLPPGRWWIGIEGDALDSSMNKRYGVEIAFTDTAGRHWQRTADGVLNRLAREPATAYDLNPPYGYKRLFSKEPRVRKQGGYYL